MSPMPSLMWPLTWSPLPDHSVERSPTTFPVSSLILPFVSSHLPSVLSFTFVLLSSRVTLTHRARPMPLPSCHVRATTTPLLDDLAARLPRGYRARAFDDSDREPIVAANNSEAHPMEHESAEEWRSWEGMIDDPQRQRLTVTTDDGEIEIGRASC